MHGFQSNNKGFRRSYVKKIDVTYNDPPRSNKKEREGRQGLQANLSTLQ